MPDRHDPADYIRLAQDGGYIQTTPEVVALAHLGVALVMLSMVEPVTVERMAAAIEKQPHFGLYGQIAAPAIRCESVPESVPRAI